MKNTLLEKLERYETLDLTVKTHKDGYLGIDSAIAHLLTLGYTLDELVEKADTHTLDLVDLEEVLKSDINPRGSDVEFIRNRDYTDYDEHNKYGEYEDFDDYTKNCEDIPELEAVYEELPDTLIMYDDELLIDYYTIGTQEWHRNREQGKWLPIYTYDKEQNCYFLSGALGYTE